MRPSVTLGADRSFGNGEGSTNGSSAPSFTCGIGNRRVGQTYRRAKTEDSWTCPRQKSKVSNGKFEAVLVGCPRVFVNAGSDTTIKNDFLGKRTSSSADTFIDRAKDYNFALIKEGDDLHVHLRSKQGFRSIGEEDDLRRFRALLEAVGFTHGVHAWPFRILHWRDGRKVLDQIHTPRSVPTSPHAPFQYGLGLTPGRNKRGTRNSPVRIAARFFSKPRRRFPQKFHVCSSFPGRVPLKQLIFGFEPYRFAHSLKES
jgi:hypothetical protein